VHPIPEIIILGGLEICEGGLIELSVGTADEYLWNSGETTQDVSIGSSGQYTVEATFGSATCESNSVDVVIHPKPNAEFLTSTNVLHRDELISFTSDDENITSWLWDFGDGGISLDQNPEYTFTEEGEYTVTLAVTSDEGCHNSSSKMFGIVTGIEDVNGRSVKAYPNPVAANAVYLEGPENVTIELELLSTEGQTIRKSTMTGGAILDVTNVGNGIYILKMVTSRDVITRKLIIAR
jgi:PKD repeat protein